MAPTVKSGHIIIAFHISWCIIHYNYGEMAAEAGSYTIFYEYFSIYLNKIELQANYMCINNYTGSEIWSGNQEIGELCVV